MWQETSDFFGQLPWNAIVLAIQLALAGFTALAALSAARSARKAHLRQPPVIEATVKQNTPWQNWTSVALSIKNPAVATAEILTISMPMFRCGSFFEMDDLYVEVVSQEKRYWDAEPKQVRYRQLPDAGPQQKGIRERLVHQTAQPQGGIWLQAVFPEHSSGRPNLPKKLIVTYRYLDNRRKTHKMSVPLA